MGSVRGDVQPRASSDLGWSPMVSPSESRPSPPLLEDNDGSVKVVVRVRPPLPRELSGYEPYRNAVAVDAGTRTVTLSENLGSLASSGAEGAAAIYNTYRFTFDAAYGPETSQAHVYEQCARPAVANILQGYNASIIAYGQTGTGKTFTMEGEGEAGERAGVVPRAIEELFASIARDTGERCRFLVRASYLQIYNEVISDLLKPGSSGLGVREDKRRGVHVDGLSEWVVRAPSEVYVLMRKGAAARATGSTKLNESSSRSHAIFTLTVEKAVFEGADGEVDMALAGLDRGGAAPNRRQTIRVGKLNLVDLAGSERVAVTGATGQRLEESKKINQSLSTLGNVISALAGVGPGRGGGTKAHVPYRESKLTRILEDSLGGNCKTTFLAMISPAVEAFPESLSTLKFAHRAKNVRNAPTVNEDLDQQTLLRKYELELRRLRSELQQKSRDLVDKRLLLELDAARRREQADKLAAISALERQSAEIMKHKAAMATLENRIRLMQSQLLVGGHRLEDNPQFRQLLAAEQNRIRSRYEARLAELEAERETMAQGQAQVDRYRVLLMKQRDVMTALTHRLGERDAQVLRLQADLEVSGEKQRQLEDRLDVSTAQLLKLQRAATEGRPPASVASMTGNVPDPIRDELDDWAISAARPAAETTRPQQPYGPILVETCVDSESEAGSAVDVEAVAMQEAKDGVEWMPELALTGTDPGQATAQPRPMLRPPSQASTAYYEADDAPSPAASITPSVWSVAAPTTTFDASAHSGQGGAGRAGGSRPRQGPPIDSRPDAERLPVPDTLLQTKLQSMRRERKALRSILEDKVAVVMQEAERTLKAHIGLQGTPSTETAQKLASQLAYIQSLVGATVSAMGSEPR